MCLLVGQGIIISALPVAPISRIQGTTCKTLGFSQLQPWMSIPVGLNEHVRLFQVKYSKTVAHRACFSVELNMHPNRQFPGLFVVHMPSCLHVLLHVTRPLCSLGGLGGAREPSIWACSPGGLRIPPCAGG